MYVVRFTPYNHVYYTFKDKFIKGISKFHGKGLL